MQNHNNKYMRASCLAASYLLSVSKASSARRHLLTLSTKLHARGVCADRASAIDAVVRTESLLHRHCIMITKPVWFAEIQWT